MSENIGETRKESHTSTDGNVVSEILVRSFIDCNNDYT